MASIELEAVIHAWESILFHNRFLMSPSTVSIVESTVRHLKRLEGLEPPKAETEKLTENSL